MLDSDRFDVFRYPLVVKKRGYVHQRSPMENPLNQKIECTNEPYGIASGIDNKYRFSSLHVFNFDFIIVRMKSLFKIRIEY